MSKIVAISQREEYKPDRKEIWDTLDQDIVKFFYEAGGWLSVAVPNSLIYCDDHERQLCPIDRWLSHVKPTAIVLSGGDEPTDKSKRSLTERILIEHSLSNQIPLVGICRGMLAIGNYFNVHLDNLPGHVRTRHQVVGVINEDVNSYHTKCLATCPKNFEILAICKTDQSIEAIQHKKLPIYGQMWHPEREPRFNPHDLLRLSSFISGKSECKVSF